MLYIAIAAGICLFVPGVLMLLCGLLSKDLPNLTIPPDLTKINTGERPTAKPSPDVQATASVQEVAAVVDEETDHPPKPQAFKRSYRWYNILMLPVFLALMVGGTVGWSFVLVWLYQRRMAELPAAVHFVEPGWASMITPAIFLGIFTTIIPMNILNRLFLGRSFGTTTSGSRGEWELQTRADARALLFRLGLLIVVPLAFFTSLAMDWYSRFSEEEIAINRFWGVGERIYPYSRVRHIVVTTDFRNLLGQVVPANRYSIVFDDGYVWCNQDMMGANTRLKEDFKILQFVSRKSGKPVVKVRLIEDVVE